MSVADEICAIMAAEFLHKKIVKLLPNWHTHLPAARKKYAIFLSSSESVREICRMYKPRNAAEWGIAAAVLALIAITAVWIGYGGSEPRLAKDYEDCAGQAQADASSNVEYTKLVTRCSERFAGRRKAGGGYAYFDFMQNRTFDIAGPNPTDDERKKIDRSYMEFLGAQRREMFLSELAKAQANQEQADLRRGPQDAGSPLDLTPKIPLPARRPAVERSKSCDDGSLSCSWTKLSAAVKRAFASSASKNQ